MTETPSAPNNDYFAKAGSWADDRQAEIGRSRKIAWIVAGAAAVVAVAEAIALAALAPLKSVEPYTLLVDRQTGFVQSLKPLAKDKIAPDTALTQSFLVQYVLAREGYDIATVQRDYKKVALWTTGPARTDYMNAMQISNPESPLARLPRSSSIDARVRSVSSVGNNTALVRFETVRRDKGGSVQPPQSFVALVTYHYSDAPMSVEDRYINPLGFEVVRYRKNAESLPVVQEPQPDVSDTDTTGPVSQGTAMQSGSLRP